MLAQAVLVVIFAGAVVAHLLAQRGARRGDQLERWLIAPAFGLLAGWVTAAFFVGFVTVLAATGVLGGGIGEAVLGALLLIVGGAFACAVILAAKTGPVQGYLAYGSAVLWALAGVFANQFREAQITSATSVFCALLVAVVLLVALRGSSATRGAGRSSRPRVA